MPDPIREAREKLIQVGLTGEYHDHKAVPELILRSWRRSIGNAVEPSDPVQQHKEVDTESLLSRAAEPVLNRWHDQLVDTGTTLFLSDRAGSIVDRRTSDSTERQRLDDMHAAEGFDYSEGSIGTNALGTSIVEKRPIIVQGSQHFSDVLAANICAAAPISTPAGLVVGSIALGGPVHAGSPIMLSLAREISHQIEEGLRASTRPQDLALAMSFIRFKNSQRPTVVFDRESVLANTPGLPYVNVASHVMLWEMLNAQHWSTNMLFRAELEGTGTRIAARRIVDGPREHFVVHFAGAPVATRDTDAGLLSSPGSPPVPPVRPVRARLLVIASGPPGSGRATVIAEMRRRWGRTEQPQEVRVSTSSETPWREITDWLRQGKDVLLRGIEDLDEAELPNLSALMHQAQVKRGQHDRPGSLLITVCLTNAPPWTQALVEQFGVTEHTKALTATPERIPIVVRQILNEADPASRFTISPAALQSLVQWHWPGNLTELSSTLISLLRTAKAPVIERRHLPKHLQQALPRRRLSMMEAAERETIIKALDTAGGNKSAAAGLLGMGRTTLYRRLRQLGLETDESNL